MSRYFGILLYVLTEFRLVFTNKPSCGTLEFVHTKLEEGKTAVLKYEPNNQTEYEIRQWLKVIPSESPPVLYDIQSPPSTRKYTETNHTSYYVLYITNIEQRDNGTYVVYCGHKGRYSNRATLIVTATKKSTENGVNGSTKQRATPTVNGIDDSIRQQGVDSSTRQDVTPIEKNTFDSTRQNAKKPFKKHADESGGPSVVWFVVGTVSFTVAVAITIAVCLVLRKKKQHATHERKGTRQKNVKGTHKHVHPAENEESVNINNAALNNENVVDEQPEYSSIAPKTERIENSSQQKREQPEYSCVIPKAERKENSQPKNGEQPEYSCVIPKAKRNDNSSQQNEQPEYSCVIPKAERNNEYHPQNGNEHPKTERGDNLVYAELDLHPNTDDFAKRVPPVKFEETEYTSIDVTKKATVQIDEEI